MTARIEELRRKFDENPRRYFAPLANEFRKAGDLAQAIALCRTHLPNQPGHISGHIILAQALYESRELPEARGVFEQALDLDPENLIALRYLGDIAREQGAPVSAQAWYQRVLEADPRNDEIRDLIRTVEDEARSAAATLAAQPTPTSVPVVAEASAPAWAPAEVAETADVQESATPSDAAHDDQPLAEGPMMGVAAPDDQQPAPEATRADTAWELPDEGSLAGWFDATPQADSLLEEAGAYDTSPPAHHDLGDLEAVAEADASDWFAPAPAPAPEARAAEEHPFPNFSVELSRPTPATTPAYGIPERWEELLEPVPAASSMPEEPALAEPPAADAPAYAHDATAPAEPEEPGVIEATDSPWVSETDRFIDLPVAAAAPEDESDLPSAESDRAADEHDLQEPIVAADEAPVVEASDDVWDPVVGRTPAFVTSIPADPPAPFVTETMAELYLQQGFDEEALAIYRQLLAQHPDDDTLRERVRALEESQRAPSPTPLATPAQSSSAPSARAFFQRIALRAVSRQGAPATESTTLGGAATRAEALTEPDAPVALADLFARESVSSQDRHAADLLASAFAGVSSAEGAPELSLDSLFGQVPTPEADAVTSVIRAPGPDASDTLSPGPGGEASADIERFTAWLEGLKKK